MNDHETLNTEHPALPGTLKMRDADTGIPGCPGCRRDAAQGCD